MIRYVTLAYGDAPGVYRQSLMLLVSLVAHAPEPYELVVATDRPDCYVWFGTRVEIEYLDSARLDGVARPAPVLDAPEAGTGRPRRRGVRLGKDPATVLLDADVLARKPLGPFVARLRAGELFMHKQEYVLSREPAPRQPQALGVAPQLDGVRVPGGRRMWNSGVLGVPTADRGLLDEALALYDALGVGGLRHFATEQLVEGVVLGRTGRLQPAEEWFAHYWGNKPGYDAEIARRLADAFIEGMSVKEAAARYREKPIDLPVEVRPDQAPRSSRAGSPRSRIAKDAELTLARLR